MRGEYCNGVYMYAFILGSPPLARGIQNKISSFLMSIGITPACAGNTYAFIPLYGVCRDHPRLRGEYYQNMVNFQSRLGSPPLARGILCDNAHINKVDRITPACAGNTASGRTARIPYLDHPRLRGEYGDMSCNPQVVMGSPPLARGIPPRLQKLRINKGITPACAGNTGCLLSPQSYRRDHPRLRGEYANTNVSMMGETGSPPLARGIPKTGDAVDLKQGITPACAGNTVELNIIDSLSKDHPRLRGEYDSQYFKAKPKPGSPPLARGILTVIGVPPYAARITPACAGNTSVTWTLYTRYQDHPRLRGEYLHYILFLQIYTGSPPLARGIH